MSSRRGENPPSGDMMDFYRTTYLESHTTTVPPAVRSPLIKGKSQTSGFAHNQKAISNVFDAVQSPDSEPLVSTSHAAQQYPYSPALPPHLGVARPISDFATSHHLPQPTTISTPGMRPFARTAVSTHALSYTGKDWTYGIVPQLENVQSSPHHTGYGINLHADTDVISRAEPADFSTSYNAFARGREGTELAVQYGKTHSSDTAFTKTVVEPPCLGVGSDHMRVFGDARYRQEFKAQAYPSGQPRVTYARGMDPMMMRETVGLGEVKIGRVQTVNQPPAICTEPCGPSTYIEDYRDPEITRELKPWHIPARIAAADMRATRAAQTMRPANVLMRTGTSTYRQTFVKHQVGV